MTTVAAVTVRCPSCSSPLKVPARSLGKAVRCPKCGHNWTAAAEEPTNPTIGGPAGLTAASLGRGSRLGDFELGKVLGRGGMGTVYEALDKQLERPAAIKVLSGELIAAGTEHVDRFLREARAAAKLDHPNVVNVYQVGRQGDIVWIAMQLVKGESAGDRLRRGPLAPADALRVTIEAARGLAAAHTMDLVHRDIKPANIMLGENGSVKLADFGLAKASSGGTVSLTTAGMVIGTPQYMSPEQCRGEAADARSDIYALGATFHCLLTGSPPFVGDSTPSILYKHVFEEPPDPRTINSDVPASYLGVLRKAMAKAPADRYGSADELIADLQAVAAGVDPSADWQLNATAPTGLAEAVTKVRSEPMIMVEPATPAASRKPLVAAIVLIAALSGAAGAWFALSGREQPPASRDGSTKVDPPRVKDPKADEPTTGKVEPKPLKSPTLVRIDELIAKLDAAIDQARNAPLGTKGVVSAVSGFLRENGDDPILKGLRPPDDKLRKAEPLKAMFNLRVELQRLRDEELSKSKPESK